MDIYHKDIQMVFIMDYQIQIILEWKVNLCFNKAKAKTSLYSMIKQSEVPGFQILI